MKKSHLSLTTTGTRYGTNSASGEVACDRWGKGNGRCNASPWSSENRSRAGNSSHESMSDSVTCSVTGRGRRGDAPSSALVLFVAVENPKQ
jgi:hypothetical protein